MARQNLKLNTPEKRARIGERIKVASTQAGLSLKELAAAAGTTPTLIYQYVRGIVAVPPDLLEKIAAVTDVHTDFFDPDKEGRSSLALHADKPSPTGTEIVEFANEPGTRARIKAEMDHLKQLRDAYLYPKRNRAAYISTMEQMLALARTIENRRQEGWILWQLGKTKIEQNLLDEARQQIKQAQVLFMDEGMEEYHNLASMDLAIALELDGQLEEAKQCLEEVVNSDSHNVQWRAIISLGSIYYRMHNNEEALRYFCRAAEHIEKLDHDQREHEGMISLMITIADIARTTGHQEEAVLLWSQCLQRSTDERMAEHFLEALMEIAQTFQEMGKLSEAKQRLELAVVLAGFLFEDESRLSVARALLADLLVTMGSIDDAKDNARASLRIAHKVRSAQPTIVSALALAETHLATSQWRDALDYSQEALDEAKRTKRTREVARARELRARAYLMGSIERAGANDTVQANEALSRAFAEATSALDHATRADAVKEMLASRLTLARCHFQKGEDSQAEMETHAALELSENGAVGLSRLIGQEALELPMLLRSPELDLVSLFASRKLDLPNLEWQAHYLKGTLLAKRLGPQAGFESLRDAAKLVTKVLSVMTPAESARFQQHNPEVVAVFDDLDRFAITDAARSEVRALLEGVTRIKGKSEQISPAAIEA